MPNLPVDSPISICHCGVNENLSQRQSIRQNHRQRPQNSDSLDRAGLDQKRQTIGSRISNPRYRNRRLSTGYQLPARKMAARIIAFSIFKGGTGKTTSSVNCAAALSQVGQRVLLVDMDQQASATKYLGIDPDTAGVNTYNSFMNDAPLSLAVVQTAFGFDLIPSHELLSAIEEMMESGKDEAMLRDRLDSLSNHYDFILIDTPPGKSMLTFNAIVAAKQIVVPVSAERMAVEGLADLIKHLHSVLWRRFEDLDQELLILFTMFKANTSHSPGIVAEARKIYRDNILPFYIPESIEFPRSFEQQKPIIEHAPNHIGTQAYQQLARWLLDEKN